jgi:hypothetical protein
VALRDDYYHGREPRLSALHTSDVVNGIIAGAVVDDVIGAALGEEQDETQVTSRTSPARTLPAHLLTCSLAHELTLSSLPCQQVLGTVARTGNGLISAHRRWRQRLSDSEKAKRELDEKAEASSSLGCEAGVELDLMIEEAAEEVAPVVVVVVE